MFSSFFIHLALTCLHVGKKMDCRLSLQLLFLTVLVCIHGTYAQCRKGEPKNGNNAAVLDRT
jgi:hypothetical protein